jgi:anti-sigma factor RsiW
MTPTLNPMKRHHERCREVRAQMSDYLDGDLDPPAATAVERHTRWCPNCRRMLSNLSRTLGGLRALRDQPTPADSPPFET